MLNSNQWILLCIDVHIQQYVNYTMRCLLEPKWQLKYIHVSDNVTLNSNQWILLPEKAKRCGNDFLGDLSYLMLNMSILMIIEFVYVSFPFS